MTYLQHAAYIYYTDLWYFNLPALMSLMDDLCGQADIAIQSLPTMRRCLEVTFFATPESTGLLNNSFTNNTSMVLIGSNIQSSYLSYSVSFTRWAIIFDIPLTLHFLASSQPTGCIGRGDDHKIHIEDHQRTWLTDGWDLFAVFLLWETGKLVGYPILVKESTLT